jgi:DNA polymerase-3 subunit delta
VAPPSRNALERDLAAGRWPPVVLLVGEDEVAARRAVETLIAALPEDERLTGVDRLSDAPLARALDAARTRTLLGGRRIVIAVEPQGLAAGGGGSAEAQEALDQYLQRLPAHATLVFVVEKADRRLKVIKRLEEVGLVIECPLPKERDMAAWVAARAVERGLRLSQPAARALADAVGTNTAIAERELEKLALVADPAGTAGGKAIGVDTVEAMLGPGRAVGAFALEDALLAGDATGAVELLERRLVGADAGTPLVLLGQMASIARRLAAAHDIVGRGGGPDEVREALGCHPFTAGKYAQAARQVGPRAGAAMAACVAADGRLKTGGDAWQALASVVQALALPRR